MTSIVCEEFQIGDIGIIEDETPSRFLVLDFHQNPNNPRASYWTVCWLPGSYYSGSSDQLWWGSYAAVKARLVSRL